MKGDYISIEAVQNGYFIKINEYRTGAVSERHMFAAKSKSELLSILNDCLPDDGEVVTVSAVNLK